MTLYKKIRHTEIDKKGKAIKSYTVYVEAGADDVVAETDTSAIESAVLRRVAGELFNGVTSKIINTEADRIDKEADNDA